MNPCNCGEVEEQASAYVDGSLSAEESLAVAAHLAGCKPCQTAIDWFRAMNERLKGFQGQPMTLVAAGRPKSPAKCSAGATRADAAYAPPRKARTVLGPYEILGQIGSGGMGVVMKARDAALNRDVALKLMHRNAYAHHEWRQRFVAEARIAGKLEHPGIPPVYLLGKNSKGYEFFSMKLVSGRTLAQILKTQRGPQKEFTLARLLTIFERVCETIGYAHSHGVIHRDLKPSNIMIGAYGEVWVLDWGLAKLAQAQQTQLGSSESALPEVKMGGGLTATGSVVGTPAYMAPEQARGEPVDVGVDIYALGAILFELLAGGPPVLGKNSNEVLLRVANGKIRPVRATAAGRQAPRALAAIAEHCLAFKRKRRYPSMAELLKDLRAFAAGEAVSVLPETRWQKTARYLQRNRKKAAVAAAAFTITCLLVTTGAVLIADEQGKARAADARANKALENSVREQLEAERLVSATLAEKAARAQRRIDAFDPYARANDLLMRGQRMDEAERLARKALTIDPAFPEAQYALAEALRCQGKGKDAADAFIQADALSQKVAGKRTSRRSSRRQWRTSSPLILPKHKRHSTKLIAVAAMTLWPTWDVCSSSPGMANSRPLKCSRMLCSDARRIYGKRITSMHNF